MEDEDGCAWRCGVGGGGGGGGGGVVWGEDVYLVEEAGETSASEVFGLIIKGCLFCHLQPNPPPSYTM